MAQSNPTEFALDGAEWWHGNLNLQLRDEGNPSVLYHTVFSKLSGDTIINGQEVKIIQLLKYLKTYYHPGPPLDSITLEPLHVYPTEDTVFIYNTYFDEFTPFICF